MQLPGGRRNRERVHPGGQAAQIQLPLQDVLENLPPESLHTRDDQERVEVATLFETPFSQKAAEDAVRLKPAVVVAGDTLPGSAPAVPGKPGPADIRATSPAPATMAAAKISLPGRASTAATTQRSALQAEFDTDEALDAKGVIARASTLPGVQACAIVFADGLSLAGNIPAGYNLEGLCATAPAIMKRLDVQVTGASLGALTGIMLLCAKKAVTFFAGETICLAALHATGGSLPSETQARLARITQYLVETYSIHLTPPNA